MKERISLFFLISLILVSCGSSPDNKINQNSLSLTETAVSGEKPSFSETTETSAPTQVPSPTFTHTPTIAPYLENITSGNIGNLELISRWGKEGTFEYIQDFVLSPSGDFLCISGKIDQVMTSVVYETSSYNVIANFPGLSNPEWTSDENILAFVKDKTIELWDFKENKQRRIIEGFSSPIKLMTIKNLFVAAVDEEDYLKIFNIESGDEIKNLFVAPVKEERYEKMFNIDSGDEIKNLQIPRLDPLYSTLQIEWSPKGKYLAILGNDEIIRIRGRRRTFEFEVRFNSPDFIAWSPDERFISTSSHSSEPNALIAFGSPDIVFPEETGFGMWSPDGKLLATVDVSGNINIRDANSLRLIQLFPKVGKSLSNLVWSPDSKLLVAFRNRYYFTIFDINSGTELTLPENLIKGITHFNWLPDSKNMVLANNDARVQTLDLETNTATMIIDPEVVIVSDFAYSPDGTMFAFAETGGKIQIRSSDNNQLLVSFDSRYNHQLEWSSDSSLLAISSGSEIQIVNPLDGTEFQSLGVGTSFSDFAWNPDINFLLIGSFPGTMNLWSLEKGMIINTWEISDNLSIKKVAWSSDGKKAAAATEGFNGEVYIWDTKTWENETYLKSNMIIFDMNFANENNNILIAGLDKNEKGQYNYETSHYQIWDIQNSELLHEWDGPLGFEFSISPDGDFLATSGGEIWDIRKMEKLISLDYQDRSENYAWSPDGKFLICFLNTIDTWGIIP